MRTLTRGLADFGETEVQHFHAAVVGDHDVAGLEVSVNHALRVRGGQGLGQGHGDLEDALERQAVSGDEL